MPDAIRAPRDVSEPRIVLCGTCYSDNLGDGAIADCLSAMLQSLLGRCDVRRLDFSGRESFADAGGNQKMAMQRIMYSTPVRLRPLVVATALSLLVPKKLRPKWRRALEGADLLVVGGGQLLQDNFLNFPIKVRGVMRTALEQGARIAVMSCGVGKRWSPAARWLLGSQLAQSQVCYRSARDTDSANSLNQHLAGRNCEPVSIVPDPALYAAKAYADVIAATPRGNKIGVGVAHPLELQTTAERPDCFSLAGADAFWLKLVRRLQAAGHEVALFTNGSEEDAVYLESLAQRFANDSSGPCPEILPRAREPRELVRQIASLRGLISYRLHANIIAFALSRPSVGLIWDAKVRSFFELTGREAWVVGPERLEAEHVCERMFDALATGVDESRRASLEDETRQGVASMLRAAGFELSGNAHSGLVKAELVAAGEDQA